jgi:hypothetical protein
VTKDEYVRSVGWELRDLPWKARHDLLADLRGHLEEVPVDQLDPPERYAADLRESAGLERRHGLVAWLLARRPRNLVLAGIGLAVIVLLIAGWVWADRYQPLATGNYSISVPQSRVGAAGEDSVTFRDGKPFEVGFSVLNDGAFTVRVTRGPHFDGVPPFSVRLYSSGPLARAHVIPGPLTPFRPFDLPPGEQRMLVLRGIFTHCRDWAGRSSFVIDSLPVTFSFLWSTQVVRIPLASPVVIQVPPGRHCLR